MEVKSMDRINTQTPPSFFVANDEELLAKLEKSREEAEKGNVMTEEEVFGRLKEKYGF
jgi:predicted transcriptional regulator